MLMPLPPSREKKGRREKPEKFHHRLPLLKVAVEGEIATTAEGDRPLAGKDVALDLALPRALAPDLEIDVTTDVIIETVEVEETEVEIEHMGRRIRKWMKRGTRRFKRGLMLRRQRRDERRILSLSPSGMMMIRYAELPLPIFLQRVDAFAFLG